MLLQFKQISQMWAALATRHESTGDQARRLKMSYVFDKKRNIF